MKNSRTPSGANTGLCFDQGGSATRIGSPPRTGNSRIELGARLPNVVPGNVEMLFCDAQTIHLPRGAQSHEWRSSPPPIGRGVPPSVETMSSVSDRTKPISSPSGDQIADCTLPPPGGTTGCDAPPKRDATAAPPRVRKQQPAAVRRPARMGFDRGRVVRERNRAAPAASYRGG